MKHTTKFLSLPLVFVLTSCGFFARSKEYLEGKTVEGNPIKYSFKLADKDKVNECLDKTLALATEAKDFKAFEASYNKMNTYYQEVSDAHEAEELKYYMYGKEENQTLSLELYEILTSIINKANKIHYVVFRNDFKSSFYGNMTDEEIIEEIGPEYTDEYYTKNNELKALKADYNNLDSESESYNKDVATLYIDYVNTANELATLAGYDNFLDYSYKNYYARPYTYEFTDSFFEYTRKYALPYFVKAYSTLEEQIASLSKDDLNAVRRFVLKNGFTTNFSLIEDYKDYFGGEFKTIFDDLWYDSRNYYISYEKEATTTAFTSLRNDEPYVFFGNRFEASTIVHEFGHYYDYSINGRTNASYDLAETQSQGNEQLFIYYLKEANKFNPEAADVIIGNQSLDMVSSVLVASMVNELEKKVYLDEDLTLEDITKYEAEVKAALPMDDYFDFAYYWRAVAIDSPCYYFSYAASAVGALEIGAYAKNDLRGAIDKYNKLINYDDKNENNYLEIYKEAGLSSPFEEVTFKTIFK